MGELAPQILSSMLAKIHDIWIEGDHFGSVVCTPVLIDQKIDSVVFI